MENFFKLVAKNKDIYYTTQIHLVDYINAYRNLKISVDKTIIENHSAFDVYIKVENKSHKIPAGSIIKI
jgi:hypothetical protein